MPPDPPQLITHLKTKRYLLFLLFLWATSCTCQSNWKLSADNCSLSLFPELKTQWNKRTRLQERIPGCLVVENPPSSNTSTTVHIGRLGEIWSSKDNTNTPPSLFSSNFSHQKPPILKLFVFSDRSYSQSEIDTICKDRMTTPDYQCQPDADCWFYTLYAVPDSQTDRNSFQCSLNPTQTSTEPSPSEPPPTEPSNDHPPTEPSQEPTLSDKTTSDLSSPDASPPENNTEPTPPDLNSFCNPNQPIPTCPIYTCTQEVEWLFLDITDLAVSPLGDLVVATSGVRTKTWGLPSGNDARSTFPNFASANFQRIAFSNNGSKIARGSATGDIYVTTPLGANLWQHKSTYGKISGLSFLEDNQSLITTAPYRVEIWNTSNTTTPIKAIAGHSLNAATIRQNVAYASRNTDKLLAFPLPPIDINNRTENNIFWTTSIYFSPQRAFKADAKVAAIATDPRGDYLLVAHENHTLRLWRITQNAGVTTSLIAAHTNQITKILFIANGTRFLSSSLDNTAKIWNTHGTIAAVLKHPSPVSSCSATPDGKLITTSFKANSGKAAIRIWQCK